MEENNKFLNEVTQSEYKWDLIDDANEEIEFLNIQ
jgi:hypothetical protein